MIVVDKKTIDPETGMAGWIVVPREAAAAIRRGVKLTSEGATPEDGQV